MAPSDLTTAILKEADAWVGAGFSSLAHLTGLVA
jgi:hypothetical protein